MKLEEIITLLEAVRKNQIDSLVYEAEGEKIAIKGKWYRETEGCRPLPMPCGEEKLPEKAEETYCILSPLVGTFYGSPSPEEPPFVQPGDFVEKGQVLGIIEAMKLMNEVECDCAGILEEILVENESIVEFGQPLFRIRKTM